MGLLRDRKVHTNTTTIQFTIVHAVASLSSFLNSAECNEPKATGFIVLHNYK